MKIFKLSKGFTLIELLVVIAIIGILSTLLLLQLNTVRSKGRDTKRITAVSQLRDAVELYFADEGSYPDALTVDTIGKYMTNGKVPLAPLEAEVYNYGKSGATKYQVWAELENKNSNALSGDADIEGSSYTPGGTDGTSIAGNEACTSTDATDCVFDLGSNQ